MTTPRDEIVFPLPSDPSAPPMIEKVRIIHLAGTTSEDNAYISSVFVYCEATPNGKPVEITRRYLESLMLFGKLPYMHVGLYSYPDPDLDAAANALYQVAVNALNNRADAFALIKRMVTGIVGISLPPSIVLDDVLE